MYFGSELERKSFKEFYFIKKNIYILDRIFEKLRKYMRSLKNLSIVFCYEIIKYLLCFCGFIEFFRRKFRLSVKILRVWNLGGKNKVGMIFGVDYIKMIVGDVACWGLFGEKYRKRRLKLKFWEKFMC